MNFSIAVIGLAVLSVAGIARAETLASSDFSSDPGAGPRFIFNGDGTLTAKVDTSLPSTLLSFSFAGGKTLTQNDSFIVTARFKMQNVVADAFGFAQVAFGLYNSTTTGLDRSGGPFSNGDALDLFSFDYYPNITLFGGPSLQNSIITSYNAGAGQVDVFSNVVAAFGSETALDNAGESPLPTDQFLTVIYKFTGATGETVLKIYDQNDVALEIDKIGDGGLAGGLDGDTTTIQTFLPVGREFTTNAFALMLWTDSWGAYDFINDSFNPQSLSADVVYDSFSVESVPEPASVSLLGLSIVGLIMRRRHQMR